MCGFQTRIVSHLFNLKISDASLNTATQVGGFHATAQAQKVITNLTTISSLKPTLQCDPTQQLPKFLKVNITRKKKTQKNTLLLELTVLQLPCNTVTSGGEVKEDKDYSPTPKNVFVPRGQRA